MRHRHDIEGGQIIHEDHDLGGGAGRLRPIPFEGHQHILALIERNYVHEISGPAYRSDELRFEFKVGPSTFDNLRDALDTAEYLNGPHLERLKEFADMEEAEEERTGVFVTNTYRRAYRRALEERPVKILKRRVTPWVEATDT